MQRGPTQFQMMVPFTGVVKKLVIINLAVWFVLQIIIEQFLLSSPWITGTFGLQPGQLLEFYIWQPVTYMFLHDVNPFHILFNMLILWWLGAELENQWGRRFFTLYYFVCGVGAALIYSAGVIGYSLLSGRLDPLYMPVIGASGAGFGLMLAYGIVFGERIVYFMFVFPLKAKYFVMILGAVELVMLLNQGIGGGGKVANLAHLGGIISGFLFLNFWTIWRRRRRPPGGGRKLRLVVDNENTPKYWH